MARRLADQRGSLVASEHRFRELFSASPTPLIRLDRDLRIREANPATEPFLHGRTVRAVGRTLAGFLDHPDSGQLETSLQRLGSGDEAVLEAHGGSMPMRLPRSQLRVAGASDDQAPGYLVAIHDLTERLRRMGEHWRRTFDAMVDGVALVDDDGRITLANRALQPHGSGGRPGPRNEVAGGRAETVAGRPRGTVARLHLEPAGEGLGHAILVVRDVTENVDAEERLRRPEDAGGRNSCQWGGARLQQPVGRDPASRQVVATAARGRCRCRLGDSRSRRGGQRGGARTAVFRAA